MTKDTSIKPAKYNVLVTRWKNHTNMRRLTLSSIPPSFIWFIPVVGLTYIPLPVLV